MSTFKVECVLTTILVVAIQADPSGSESNRHGKDLLVIDDVSSLESLLEVDGELGPERGHGRQGA